MKSIFATVLAATAAATLTGCIVEPRHGYRHGGYQQPYYSDDDRRYYDDRDDDWHHHHGKKHRDDDRLPTLVCASKDGRPNRCRTEFPIRSAEVDKRYSNSPCTYGRTWGYDGNEVWVDRGCRARFRLVPAGRWR